MIDWSRRSYTEEEFRQAWSHAISYADVLRRLDLNKSGGSVRIVKETAEFLGLTPDRFIYAGSSKRYTLDEILVKDSPFNNSTGLHKRLVKAGLKGISCERCGLSEWMGEPIPVQLDHVNGDNRDNRLENLNVLCANCHAQTPTWCGRNKVRKTQTGNLPGIGTKKYLCRCGSEMDSSAKECLSCYNSVSHEKFDYPSTDVMVENIEKYGYYKYAKELSISDNGLRNLLRRRGVDPLPQKIK